MLVKNRYTPPIFAARCDDGGHTQLQLEDISEESAKSGSSTSFFKAHFGTFRMAQSSSWGCPFTMSPQKSDLGGALELCPSALGPTSALTAPSTSPEGGSCRDSVIKLPMGKGPMGPMGDEDLAHYQGTSGDLRGPQGTSGDLRGPP